jgi:uncharacterized protein (TIGR03437 family)
MPLLAAVVLTLSGAANAQFSTAPGSPFPVGSGASSIAVGDFNGDGKQDLAVANVASGNVTVLLGNGSGGFSAAAGSPFTVGSFPYFLTVGDFNGDGKLDLAVADTSSNDVTILLGNGSGAFSAAPGSPFAAGADPYSLAVGDFNGDGNLDLAVANAGHSVTVLLGNGSGGFSAAPGSPFAAGSDPDSIVTGDFNGDGKLDLAVANARGDNVTILLGNGSGGFSAAPGSPFAAGSDPTSIALGDFNGDGKLDLAASNGDSNSVTVLLGNGSGGFSASPGSPFTVGSLPYSLAVGDFNGDGRLDIAVADATSNNIAVLFGNGSGGFSPAPGSPFVSGAEPYAVAAGDFNGDGKLDLAVTSYFNSVTVLLNLFPYACINTTPPVITSIDSASAFGGHSFFTSGSWLEIKGSNLANPDDPRILSTVTRGQWTSGDFNGVNAPTVLDGISVSINGKAAYVWYLSATQLNVQAPEEPATGNAAITVTNCNATSTPWTLTYLAVAPGLLAPPNFIVGGTQYMEATFASGGAYVLNTSAGAALGLTSRPAKPGDLIVAYGVGFGNVTPSILPGVIVEQANSLVNPVTFSFGSANAALAYSGLASGFIGLYEFYITVPAGLANGDYQINVTQNGAAVPQTMFLTVQN